MPQPLSEIEFQVALPVAKPVPLLLGADWQGDHPGGLNRYHADLFAALNALGIPARATILGPAPSESPGLSVGGRFDQRIPARLWGFSRGATRAGSGDVTVVDAHFAFYAFWPVVLGRLSRLPLVVHFQGPWAAESGAVGEASRWRLAAKRHLEGAVYRRARVVVVLSAAFKELLVDRYGVAPWLIEVIPPGVDLDHFVPGSRSEARARLGLDSAAPVVVAVRRLVPRMGLDVLLAAWPAVVGELPAAELVVVGDGPDRERLEALAAGSARFVGQVDEETLLRWYQAADLTVVPTLALEGFGLVVLESLACGTPALVTDVGGLPDALAGLDPSLIVPRGNVEALSGRMRTALSQANPPPDQAACRAHANKFSWPAIAERHRTIYARASHPPAQRRLRVVYLDHCAQLSGGELALLRLLPALDGVDAHVILAEDGPLVARLRRAGVSVEVFGIADSARSIRRDLVRPGRVPATVLAQSALHVARLAQRLRRLAPDLVHTNSLKADLYGGAAARLASIPVVWHVHDRIAEDYLPRSACRLVRAAARIVPNAIIANSRSTLETLQLRSSGVAVPCPLGFSPYPSPVTLPGPMRTIGMVGRLDRWKGQHIFLDAFAKAFPGGEERAVIVGATLFGESEYLRELKRQAGALGLESRVEFRGFRHDIEAELRRLDVLVHASTSPEPFGQVVIEGMAAGLPVVAVAAGGPAEVIQHGVDGLLYPMGDVGALARLLEQLAADPALRQRLGTAACRRAADFTPGKIAPQFMAIYQELVSAPSKTKSSRRFGNLVSDG